MNNLFGLGFVVFVVGLIGYVINLIDAINVFVSNNHTVTTLDIGHVIGVFIPVIGAVLGYF